MHKLTIDLTGKRFGRLVVIRDTNERLDRQVAWLCRCDCGKEKLIRGHSLRVGETTSCGCFNREVVLKKCTLPKGQAGFNRYYSSIKYQAKRRGYCFELSEEQVRSINSQKCIYCGAEPSQRGPHKNRSQHGKYVYNGIDRIDNSLGYTIDNVVPCCRRCNIAKGVLGVDDFKMWVVRVYKHWASKSELSK